MKMSTSDTSRNVLERLKSQEKNRDWTAVSSLVASTPRRWSAESGKDAKNRWQHLRRSYSPQHLPRLQTPPEYQHNHNLRRGKLDVIPPVQSPRKQAFVEKTNGTVAQQNSWHQTNSCNHYQLPDTNSAAAVIPTLLPYMYGHPSQGNPMPPMVQNTAPPFPAGMYPVPLYMGYAPMFGSHVPYPGRVPMGNMLQGSQDQQHYKRQMTREEAATRIQRYFRGWKVRRTSRYLQLQWLSISMFARSFTEELINEFLTEEIVPDLLIDVLSHKKILAPHDPQYKVAGYVCSDIVGQEVSMFIHQIAASVYYPQVPIQLISPSDPLHEVCQELVNEVVSETALPIVQSTIGDLVSSHMTISKSDDWLEDLILETIEPMVYHVATVSVGGYKFESIVDEMVDEVTDELTQPVIVEAWREVINSQRNTQSKKIGKYAEGRILDSLCLQHLLTHLAGNNLSLYFRDYMEQIMDGLICGVVTQQYMCVHDKQEESLSNHALKEYHEELFTDMALDVILDEMSAHLDEDMQDLLEKEKIADKPDWLLPW